jgi:DNA-binding response OmpR family regulator
VSARHSRRRRKGRSFCLRFVGLDVLFLANDADPGADRLAETLHAGGYVVRRATRAAEAEHLFHGGAAELLIADADLLDGEALTRILRERPGHPVVGWLARASSDRSAELLEWGAADVLSATMGDREVSARVSAALRTDGENPSTVYGPLAIDEETAEVRWEGSEVRLTRRERQVLQALAAAAGRTVRRDRLYRQVWGYAMARGDRSVDVNVKRLRAKLANAAGGRLEITTQPGVGYRLELREPDVVDPQPLVVTSL